MEGIDGIDRVASCPAVIDGMDGIDVVDGMDGATICKGAFWAALRVHDLLRCFLGHIEGHDLLRCVWLQKGHDLLRWVSLQKGPQTRFVHDLRVLKETVFFVFCSRSSSYFS